MKLNEDVVDENIAKKLGIGTANDLRNRLSSGGTKWWSDSYGDDEFDIEEAQMFDRQLGQGPLRRVGSKKFNGWDGSYEPDVEFMGQGSYGTVVKNPDGTFVKRGAISETEPDLIRTLGKKDLGPKLIAADVNGNHDWHSEDFVKIRNGRIAMTEVPGYTMGNISHDSTLAGKPASDVYWKTLGDLHRLGIAHNDAHVNNIMVDDNGKGRWVDLGLAQRSPKAALAEALGSFSAAQDGWSGNWQTRRWDATGIPEWERKGNTASFKKKNPNLSRIVENRAKVFNQLHDYGLTVNDYAKMTDTPIRSPLDTYKEGPWAKLTDEQAQNLINTLYDGI